VFWVFKAMFFKDYTQISAKPLSTINGCIVSLFFDDSKKIKSSHLWILLANFAKFCINP
jgi:hypothetical protein